MPDFPIPEEQGKTNHKKELYPEECMESAEKAASQCNEIIVGSNENSGISSIQLLAAGVAEANLLTITHDRRPVWRKNLLDLHLSLIQQGKDVSPIAIDYPGSHAALQRAIDSTKVKD